MQENRQKTGMKWCACIAALCFFAALIFVLPEPLAVRGAGAEPTHITVCYYDGPFSRGWTWQTESGVADGEVQITEKTAGMAGEEVDWAAPGATKVPATASPFAYGTVGTLAWKADYDFEPLSDGKTYFYRVGSPAANVWSPVGEQKINGGTDGLRLIHITDTQYMPSYPEYRANYDDTMKAAFEIFPSPDGVVHTGDIADGPSDNVAWGYVLNGPRENLMDTVIVPVMGNHDTWGHENRFNIQKTNGNWYYSYDVGSVHITVAGNAENGYTSGYISSAQTAWLNADLDAADKNPNIKWKIVAMHISVVSGGYYVNNSYTEGFREALMPIMAAHKVDLVLQGHEHSYARSLPLDWNVSAGRTPSTGYGTAQWSYFGAERKYMENPSGATYITLNPASAYTRGGSATLQASLLAAHPDSGARTYGMNAGTMFGALTVRDSALLYETYAVNRTTGEAALFDYVGITKFAAGEIDAVPPAPITVISPNAGETPDTSVADGTGYRAILVWEDAPEAFDYDTAYTALLTLQAKIGYTFGGYTDTASIAGFTVNGIAPEYVSSSAGTLEFSVTFPKTRWNPNLPPPDDGKDPPDDGKKPPSNPIKPPDDKKDPPNTSGRRRNGCLGCVSGGGSARGAFVSGILAAAGIVASRMFLRIKK
ncbi:MAG: metallophosphoesterase family protein [Firmicutes bacterium]|nr:metallophosphoesterase family protein [Bacillota bacterium]